MSDETAPNREEDREEIGKIAELVTLFHAHDIHLPTRAIYMGSTVHDDGEEGGVDATMAESVVKNLHVLEAMSPDPITIFMNNIGGDEYHGCAIFDAIKASRCRVVIVARGHAMSMGSIILQAAAERVMGPTTMQMIHYGTWGTHTHAKTAQKQAAEGRRLDEWMEQMYLERIRQKQPRFTLTKLRKLLDHDTYLTAQQSIDLGLADRIG